MNHSFLLAALLTTCFFYPSSQTLAENPLSVEGQVLTEGVSVLSGGLKKGVAAHGFAVVGVDFDTQKARWWEGGSFRFAAAMTRGGDPSAQLIGDFQIASNIEADNLTYLQEFWFQQEVNRWKFIVGLQDLNVELVASDAASLFLNSTLGTPSTIATNVPSPIFPLTALGAQIHFNASQNLTLKMAFFDGMPEDFDSNPHNVAWRLNASDGCLAFAEMELKSVAENPAEAVYKLGYYWHDHWDVHSMTNTRQTNYGFYFTADQPLFSTSSQCPLRAFLMLAASPASTNYNYRFLGVGLTKKGLISRRKNDECGLALAYAGLKSDVSETTLELTYKCQLSEFCFVQPDLQYIVNPSGTSYSLDNAVVGMLRLGLQF